MLACSPACFTCASLVRQLRPRRPQQQQQLCRRRLCCCHQRRRRRRRRRSNHSSRNRLTSKSNLTDSLDLTSIFIAITTLAKRRTKVHYVNDPFPMLARSHFGRPQQRTGKFRSLPFAKTRAQWTVLLSKCGAAAFEANKKSPPPSLTCCRNCEPANAHCAPMRAHTSAIGFARLL